MEVLSISTTLLRSFRFVMFHKYLGILKYATLVTSVNSFTMD